MNNSRGLLFPTAHQGSDVHLLRVLPRLATLRLQGLATLLTLYSVRTRAGFVSHRQRSWDSPFGAFSSRKVAAAFPRRSRPHAVFPVGVSRREERWAGPTGRGFWVLTLPGVPGRRFSVIEPETGCSLGFRPPRASWPKPCSGFRPSSSRALSAGQPSGQPATAPRSINRPRLGLFRPSSKAGRLERAALSGFLHQYDPERARGPVARAMDSPLANPRIAAGIDHLKAT